MWRQGALEPEGPHASSIAGLGALFFWICLVVFVSVVGMALWAFARAARRGVGAGHEPLPIAANTERSAARAVGAATVVSVLLLAAMLVASIATGRSLEDLAPPKPLRVKVTGHQWWWNIEYPGNRPDEQVVTANELYVPAGVPVELELQSADVIHSFWIPNLDGKHDLIPSHSTKTVLIADYPGSYAGRCAEFCGYQHAHMDLVLVALPPSDFLAWLASQRGPAHEPQTASERRGRELVERGPCALCHNIAGSAARGGVGPDLSHFAGRATLAAGAAPREREPLRRWLRNPNELKPGAQMPAVALNDQDLNAVVDYLESLR